jgi:hypothetical protein
MSRKRRPHATVRVCVKNLEADIDVEIAPLIREMWLAGIETVLSCQENPKGWVWIEFLGLEDMERFLAAIDDSGAQSDSLFSRMAWESSDLDTWWDYEIMPQVLGPSRSPIVLSISIRFPRSDRGEVQRRLKRYNRRR